jgi:hypothetical protein
MQVVARTQLPGEFRILPLAFELGVPPSKVKKHLRVALGDTVQQGQTVAKRVKSPISGMVTAIGGGRMLIEAQPTPFELRAHIPGQVTAILRDYGVVVETNGALIQGTWGTGEENVGVIKCLIESPDEILGADLVDPASQGSILIAGAGMDLQVLQRAIELQVRGIVTGGLAPELIPEAQAAPFPVIATEGVGTIPMSPPVFQLLTSHDGREAAISGRFKPRWGIVRPEIIIPLPAESVPGDAAPPGSPLAVGDRVRIIRDPYLGAVGKITKLPGDVRSTETGARVQGAEIDMGQASPVFVPLANLEILR